MGLLLKARLCRRAAVIVINSPRWLCAVLERYGIPLQIENLGANAGCSRRISGSKIHRDLSIGF
jgi:hypothetical protein